MSMNELTELETPHDVWPWDRKLWREAARRIKCPVVWEFFAHFALPMPKPEADEFTRLLRTVKVSKGTRDVEWRRAVYLADKAVRVFAPIDLERNGRAAAAAAMRALPRLRTPYDFRWMDGLPLIQQHEGVNVSLAVRVAATWASSLGDRPRPAMAYQRVNGGRAAGRAMQHARAWREGMDALQRVRKIV